MKIALLLCDESNSGLLDEFGGYRNMFFDVINEGDDLTVFPIYLMNNELNDSDGDEIQRVFPNTEEFDGFIVSGSKAGVYDDFVWIAPLFSCIREISTAKKKLLGVCFGHQAIISALGGSVSKSDKGWGIGNYENQWVQSPFIGKGNHQTLSQSGGKKWKKGQSLTLLAFHQDQVDTLPEGFDVVASSDFTPYFVTQYQEHILTTQGHPEMSSAYISALSYLLEEKIGKDITQAGRDSLLEKDDTDDFRQLIKDFWIA